LETVRFYRRIWPDVPLVVSVWRDENAAALQILERLGCHIVLSDKPDVAGMQNVNYQALSSRAGIRCARALGCEYVAKTRSDQRLGRPRALPMLRDLLALFPIRNGGGQRERILSTSFLTAAFTPFFVSDQFLFGHAADMELYFSPPLENSGRKPSLDGRCLRQVENPENYLAVEFLKRFGRDTSPTLAASWRALAEAFLIIDREMLDLYWPKYNPNTEDPTACYDDKLVWHVFRFQDWLRIYLQYDSATDLPDTLLDSAALSETPERLRAP
jgi:hypothetical protein